MSSPFLSPVPRPTWREWFQGERERLGAIVLKETRQGLRTRMWLGGFIGLQVFLCCSILLQMEGMAADVVGFDPFWPLVGFIFCILQPWRAYRSLSLEQSGKSLELVFITRLTPWRFLAGKWLAVMAQTLLLVTALLPYMVLRYLVTSGDMLSEAVILWGMFMFSAVTTAAGIAAASIPQFWARPIIAAGLGFCVGGTLLGSAFELGRFNADLHGLYCIFWIALLATLISVPIAAELGCQQIAPAAQQRPWRKRVIVLAVVVLIPCLLWLLEIGDGYGFFLPIMLLLLQLISLSIICEEEDSAAAVTYLPFAAWRLPWPIRSFFLPGWPAILSFGVISLPLAYLSFTTCAALGSFLLIKKELWAAAALTANWGSALLFPLFFIRLEPHSSGLKTLTLWVVAQAVQIGGGLIVVASFHRDLPVKDELAVGILTAIVSPTCALPFNFDHAGLIWIHILMLFLEVVGLAIIASCHGTGARQEKLAREIAAEAKAARATPQLEPAPMPEAVT